MQVATATDVKTRIRQPGRRERPSGRLSDRPSGCSPRCPTRRRRSIAARLDRKRAKRQVASSTASGVDLGCRCTNTPGPVIAGPVIALSPPTPHRGRVTVQWWTRAEGGQFSGADRGSVFTCRWQAQAVQLLLDALETGSDIFDDLDQIRSLHPRNNTFPGEVFMGLAARALAEPARADSRCLFLLPASTQSNLEEPSCRVPIELVRFVHVASCKLDEASGCESRPGNRRRAR